MAPIASLGWRDARRDKRYVGFVTVLLDDDLARSYSQCGLTMMRFADQQNQSLAAF